MAEVLIYGAVNKDGTFHAKNPDFDFSAGKEAEGLYRIDFQGLFDSMPTVIATQNWRDWDDFEYAGGNTLDNAVLVSVDAASARIVTGVPDGTHRDRNFAFVAVGQSQVSVQVPQIAHGSINQDNTKERGTGNFEMGPEASPGRFEVDFNDGLFNGPTAVVLTQQYNIGNWDNFKFNGGSTRDNAVLVAADNSYAMAITGQSNGARDDRNFTVMALGPGPAAATLPAVAYGAVNKDGSIANGSGNFRIIHIGEGAYIVDFEAAGFGGMPTVALTQNWRDWDDPDYSGGNTLDNAVLVAVDRNYARVVTGVPDGKHRDRNFAFIAMDV